jgi:CRP/FNR family cyclic AMP-dependent transcriptional regulator
VKFDLLGLEDPVRREVLAVAAWRRFDRGVVLFHEGEAGGSLYVLMRGQVAVRATTQDGDTATLNVIGPGAAFGELSLLEPAAARTATVQAIEPVQTLVLQRADFERLRRSYPSVDRLMVDYLAAQVRRLSERLTEALCFEARTRVLRRLLDLDGVFDSGPVPVTQEEISTMAGTTRPTVNRVMQDLAQAGIIELRRDGSSWSIPPPWPARPAETRSGASLPHPFLTRLRGGWRRAQALGELACSPGRDDVSLAFEEQRGLFAESRGVTRGSGQLPDLGEIQQPVALQVKLV